MIPTDQLVKIGVSVLLGGTIGLERELSNKVAGLRTNTLICLGATVFTMLSMDIFGNKDAHVIAQIIAGIGFIGTGAILKEGDHIFGLTTAATIWIVAAIGMAVGLGEISLAGLVTVTTLFIQWVFKPLKQKLHHLPEVKK